MQYSIMLPTQSRGRTNPPMARCGLGNCRMWYVLQVPMPDWPPRSRAPPRRQPLRTVSRVARIAGPGRSTLHELGAWNDGLCTGHHPMACMLYHSSTGATDIPRVPRVYPPNNDDVSTEVMTARMATGPTISRFTKNT